ncbi:hypothetical protein GQ53DRAFT_741972 [Thozetella sp. PMI_491]|nr:hypothetical protein GQ53DRAFT_741972 [Thozetella sp. PMI_491]
MHRPLPLPRGLQHVQNDAHGSSQKESVESVTTNWLRYIGKRLREASNSAKQISRGATVPSCDGQPSEESSVQTDVASEVAGYDSLQLISRSDNVVIAAPGPSSSRPRNLPCDAPPHAQGPNLSYDLPISTTVLSALMINGNILGLSATSCVPARSNPASPDVPLSLHPTTVQLLNMHHIGLDRFPFPKMRDNAIIYSGLYDDEEFGRDLYIMPSFTLKAGAAAWDPTAWKMEKGYAEKWGFLFRDLSLMTSEELDRASQHARLRIKES